MKFKHLIAYRAATLFLLIAMGFSVSVLATTPQIAPVASTQARSLYETHKSKLVQIRVLVDGSQSQASAGSGFLVAEDGLIVTNYHVISQLVMEPERYKAELVRTDQSHHPIQVVAIDVIHDLALVRTDSKQKNGEPWPIFALSNLGQIKQGDKIFSLGNPLDMGFAISEGAFNGYPERSLYPQMLFTGAMNRGVSGGPAINALGIVVGVNVASYNNAQLTNFLVPVDFVHELLGRSAALRAVPIDSLKKDVSTQLMTHQKNLLNSIHNGQWRTQTLGGYQVPVMSEKLARCWGDASEQEKKNYRFETAQCNAQSGRYVSGNMVIGSASLQHEASRTDKLGALRFSNLRTRSFKNEKGVIRRQDKLRTASRCVEDFIQAKSMVLRAVVCLRAYKKHEGLYDITVLSQTQDAPLEGLESTLRLDGVELEKGLQYAQQFVNAIARRQEVKP